MQIVNNVSQYSFVSKPLFMKNKKKNQMEFYEILKFTLKNNLIRFNGLPKSSNKRSNNSTNNRFFNVKCLRRTKI